MYQTVFKRLFDIVLSLTLLLLLSPLLLVAATAIHLMMGRPVLFRQQRPGLHGRPFFLYKFRTMSMRSNTDQSAPDDDKRLSALGRLLRRWSIDEFPQLVNVLVGDLSLVGPRPLLMEYLSLYSVEQQRRHDVRPGLTGWAQIKGRNALTWPEKFALDLWYVDHVSFLLDLRILAMTLLYVFESQGVQGIGNVPFRGDDRTTSAERPQDGQAR